jgi:hypothetical protein
MPVINGVFVPGTSKKIDPKDIKPDEENKDPSFWARKAEEEEAKTRYEVAKKEREEASGAKKPDPKEPAFQVKGSVNLGEFDLMKSQQQMETRLKEQEEKYQASLAAIDKEKEDWRDKAHDLEMQHLEQSLNTRIENLTAQLATNPRANLSDQIAKIKEEASLLGLQPIPFAGAGAGASGGETNVSIQLMKMQMDMRREEREFQWKLHQDDRMFELEKIKVQNTGVVDSQKIQLERERNNMLASLPEQVGSILVKGILDSGSSDGGIATRPASRPPANQKRYQIEMLEGESGQFACPVCGAEVGVGPATQIAKCVSCGTQMPVVRQKPPVGSQQQELAPEEQERNG